MQAYDASESQSFLWERFQTANAKKHLPQAILLIGPQTANPVEFAFAMASAMLCKEEKKPCAACKMCRLIGLKEHPDLHYLEPDKSGGVIKIDQIRELHGLAHRSPQLGNKRVIVLNPAEKMNVPAANALLKLLEEPPETVFFILIAEQISSLPSTIVSRCQLWRFKQADFGDGDYLTLAQNAKLDAARLELAKQLPLIIADLAQLMNNTISCCSLAEKWSAYELNHLIWLLYLINCQLINYTLKIPHPEKEWTAQLYSLSHHFHAVKLFRLIDTLEKIRGQLLDNLNLNPLLVLENLLFAYVGKFNSTRSG